MEGRRIEYLGRQAVTGGFVERAALQRTRIPYANHAIASRLLEQAFANGIGIHRARVEARQLGGGNTARAVLHLTSRSAFIVKIDDDPNLVAEARVLLALQQREDLPVSFRRRFPAVVAIKDDPPYGYVMEAIEREDGYIPLDELLFSEPALPADESIRLAHALLDVLLEAYEASMNPRLRPDLEENYVTRIESRLGSIDDPLFTPAPIELRVRRGGTLRTHALRPWSQYLSVLKASPELLRPIEARFSTFVHGDLNPGNILVRVRTGQPDIRFIDPKEWGDGDYVFDVAKINHYLLGTGPVERVPGHDLRVERALGGWRIQYTLEVPTHAVAMAEVVWKRVLHFAAVSADTGAARRYALGLAANLLGLPRGRLEKGSAESAVMLYTEGLVLLHDICAALEERRPFSVVSVP